MNLSLLITARCNASCAHCSTSCGPHRTESLTRDQIFALMDQVAALSKDESPEFYLSGGEPFLDFPLLLEILAHGRQLGAVVTCVTNGYWATSDEKARSVLAAVKKAGLAELAVSHSRFHEPFVSRQRVQRVLQVSRALGMRCTLKHVRSSSTTESRKHVSAWAKSAGAAKVQELPLMPYLRQGVALPESEYVRSKGLPRGSCPAPLFTVREDGMASTCCTPGGFNELLDLGSVQKFSLQELRDRFYLGGTQQILRSRGPYYFARAIQAQGFGSRLRSEYSGICDLCTHIAGDLQLAAIARQSARDFEVSQLAEILKPAVRTRTASHLKGKSMRTTSDRLDTKHQRRGARAMKLTARS